jgi:fused signal recognition particle receptor
MFKFLKEKLKSLIRKERRLEEEREKEKTEEKKEEVAIAEKEEKKEEKREEKVSKEEEEKVEKLEKKEKEAEEKKAATFFDKFGFGKIKITEDKFEEFFDELRLVLWQNNVANEVVEFIENSLKKDVVGKEVKKKEYENFIRDELVKVVKSIFVSSPPFIELVKEKLKEKKPVVVVFFGINGSGKTTTIAKIAWLLKKNKLSCVLAAGDTFRAASIEQLEKHAKRLDVGIVKHKYGSDPAAVAFDAINYAKAHGIDVVLIDTSGRMHTEKNLMDEMKKICRVAKPDFRVFVGEAIVGNDAVEQGKAFNEAVGIDGIVLAKADVDEKGGAVLSISYITKKPIWFLGIGQGYDDLEAFDVEKVIGRIL